MNRAYTWIELSSSALLHNIMQLKQVASSTELALVLKSNAYGHGAYQIASILDNHSAINLFCTASISEALTLRSQGIKKPLFALSYLDGNLEEAVKASIQCTLYTYEDAVALSNAAIKIGKPVLVHVKVDTGMSRLGIMPHEAFEFIQAIKKLPMLIIHGIFTHLSDTSNSDQSFTHEQITLFDNLIEDLKKHAITFASIHAQSSSGLSVPLKNSYTMIRVGALAYGIWKSSDHTQLILQHYPTLHLKSVLTLKTKIIQIKEIPKGATVGYNRTFTAQHPMKIAIIPVGYNEGYSRRYSNTGKVFLLGKFAPILGIVSMNLSAIDITHIPQASLYDEITLIGSASLEAQDCAQSTGCIANEVVTALNPGLPRIIVD